jgi:hypothetical protein
MKPDTSFPFIFRRSGHPSFSLPDLSDPSDPSDPRSHAAMDGKTPRMLPRAPGMPHHPAWTFNPDPNAKP